MKYQLPMMLVLSASAVANNVCADELSTSLTRCAAIAENAARLDCYDAVVTALQGAKESSSAPLQAAMSDETAYDAGADQGETLAPDVMSESTAAAGRNERSSDLIEGTITAIQYLPTGARIVTLDDGQRWREIETSPSLKLDVGQSVHVRPGIFGSYRLFGEGNRGTRVKRQD